MKILVYGAGVLGCNLARNLFRAGKDVTLLARGNWAEEIRKNGLRIKDKFSLRTSVSCIPVVTIGPSIAAMFYVTLKMVRNEESYIVRGFFKSFKQNLKQGIVINLIMLAAALLLYFDISICRSTPGTIGKVLMVLFMMILVVYLMIFLYIYPVLAKFYNTIKNTFTNAFLMSIRHLPYTALMILVTAAPVLVFFIPSAQVQSMVILLLVLIGFSGIAYINSHFFVKIFDKYIPEETSEPNPDSVVDHSLDSDNKNL